MDKKTIENLKQFKKFDKLFSCVYAKYKENINKFTINNASTTSYKVPVIIDILPNKEIIFNHESSNVEVEKGSPIVSSIEAACKISLANFLNYPYEKYESELDLELWFDRIIEKNNI